MLIAEPENESQPHRAHSWGRRLPILEDAGNLVSQPSRMLVDFVRRKRYCGTVNDPQNLRAILGDDEM